MSLYLPHLITGWDVDQAIVTEEEKIVIMRFGHDWDHSCMIMDDILHKIEKKVENMATIYLVDTDEVDDFNKMYELYDSMTILFFFRNRHIMIDLGTGNNQKINFLIENEQEVIDIIETVYRGANKGHGLVVSPTQYNLRNVKT